MKTIAFERQNDVVRCVDFAATTFKNFLWLSGNRFIDDQFSIDFQNSLHIPDHFVPIRKMMICIHKKNFVTGSIRQVGALCRPDMGCIAARYGFSLYLLKKVKCLLQFFGREDGTIQLYKIERQVVFLYAYHRIKPTISRSDIDNGISRPEVSSLKYDRQSLLFCVQKEFRAIVALCGTTGNYKKRQATDQEDLHSNFNARVVDKLQEGVF